MSEPLDSPQACFHELVTINKEIAEYGHVWAGYAGELKMQLAMEARLRREALRVLKRPSPTQAPLTVAEKDAEASYMVGKDNPGIYERIEFLEGEVERCKIQFRQHDRRASNAQSVLAALKREAGLADYLYE